MQCPETQEEPALIPQAFVENFSPSSREAFHSVVNLENEMEIPIISDCLGLGCLAIVNRINPMGRDESMFTHFVGYSRLVSSSPTSSSQLGGSCLRWIKPQR